jgi:hypothetical protein
METLLPVQGVATIDRHAFEAMMMFAGVELQEVRVQPSAFDSWPGRFGDALAGVICQYSMKHQGAEVEIRRMGERWMGTHTGLNVQGDPRVPITYCRSGALREDVYEARIKGADASSRRFLAKYGDLTELL